MSGADDFLSRWSRRKFEAKRPDPADAPAPEQEPETPLSAEVRAPAESSAEPPPDLPDPEALTAESDLSAFLREGIPERLRNAALRRMWSLDPSIRDFAGDARDYAYDWNSPGGVPGFGPILPSDDVQAMLAGIFGSGERPAKPDEPAASGIARDGFSSPPDAQAGEEPAQEAGVGRDAAASPSREAVDEEEGTPAALPAPVPTLQPGDEAVHDIASLPAEVQSRRHGGAKPV